MTARSWERSKATLLSLVPAQLASTAAPDLGGTRQHILDRSHRDACRPRLSQAKPSLSSGHVPHAQGEQTATAGENVHNHASSSRCSTPLSIRDAGPTRTAGPNPRRGRKGGPARTLGTPLSLYSFHMRPHSILGREPVFQTYILDPLLALFRATRFQPAFVNAPGFPLFTNFTRFS